MMIGNVSGGSIGEIMYDMSKEDKINYKEDLLEAINKKMKELEELKQELELM